MVKKKITETENNIEKKHTETTEDKDNKHNISLDKGEQAEISSDLVIEKPVSKAEEPGEDASDKVVPEERKFEEKLAEMQDKYLRLSAEFDNYRKRTLREKMEISNYAGEDLLLKILPIMDDFERALRHMETTIECIALKEGIDLIYGKLTDFLIQQGVKEIESVNTSFNVDLHDAVAKIPVEEEDKKGKIVDVLLKGYYLQDKIIRHSKVVVGE
jgi:molecular chaperone GrpE